MNSARACMMVAMATRATSTTNIAALKQAIYSFIAMLMPIQGFSGHKELVFAKTTILHSIAVL